MPKIWRRNEARKHKEHSLELLKLLQCALSEQKQTLHDEIRREKAKYSEMKKLRWTLLTNGAKLSDDNSQHLSNILEAHSDLSVCYAMKEELCQLFQTRDPVLAEQRWNDWFSAAEESNIPALVHFANLKRQRIDGLIAHAVFPIRQEDGSNIPIIRFFMQHFNEGNQDNAECGKKECLT